MKNLEKVTFERFNLKKYQKYQQQGMPVRLVTGRGVEVHIIASNVGLDKKSHIVETEVQYDSTTNKPFVLFLEIDNKGIINQYSGNANNRVYIQIGCIDIENGDIILEASQEDGSFYFMYIFDGIACIDGKGMPGFCLKHGVDMYGGQYHACGTFHDTDKSALCARVATDEEEEKYWKLLEDNEMRRNEDGTRLVFYPKVGKKYWTVELQNGGLVALEHDAPTCEEERPIHDMCFESEYGAIRQINKMSNKH